MNSILKRTRLLAVFMFMVSRQMLEMEFRWYNLANRIKSTDDRIRLIEEGKIDIKALYPPPRQNNSDAKEVTV